MSDRRRKLNLVRRKVVAGIRATRPTCEGYPLLAAYLDWPAGAPEDRVRVHRALLACRRDEPSEAHEPLKRSRGGSIVDAAGIQWLCSPCHRFTESEVRLSTIAGLLIPSTSR